MLIPQFEFKTFPAGEVHVEYFPDKDCDIQGIKNDMFDGTLVYLEKKSDESLNDYLVRVLLACQVASRYGAYSVLLPYLPYSRQDRITDKNEPFSLMLIGEIFNHVTAADEIFTLDAHSDVAGGVFSNLRSIHVSHFLEVAGIVPENYTLVIPDVGAQKKLGRLTGFKNTVQALKHRDTKTGALTLEGVHGDVFGKNCLIVDDICDGGYTFEMIASCLKTKGANKITLAITHGVFSKGFDKLKESGIDAVITTNSFPDVVAKAVNSGMSVVVIDCIDIFNQYVNAGMPY